MLKRLRFVEHDVAEFAVRVAVRMGAINLKRKRSKTDPSVLLVRIPRLSKFEQVRDTWKATQQVWEQTIKEERTRLNR